MLAGMLCDELVILKFYDQLSAFYIYSLLFTFNHYIEINMFYNKFSF